MAKARQTVEEDIPSAIAVDIRHPIERIEYRPAAIRRISWGAALAGVVLALVTQLVLNLLGISMGMSTMDRPTGDTSWATMFGTAAGIWGLGSWCIALLLGGWAAGRLAGMPRRLDATLHGVLTWAFTTLILFYLLTTAVASLVYGEFRTLSTLLATSGRGVATTVPSLDLPWEDIRQDIDTTLRPTGAAPFQRDPLGETTQRSAARSATAQQDLMSMIERVIRQDPSAVSTADREAVVEAMAARTGMSREQAARTLQRWEQDYQSAQAELVQAPGAVDTTVKTASQAALWTVVTLALGGLAAALGGALGTPRDLHAAVVREV